MISNSSARRDVFQAIADPQRRAIIALLARKKLTLNGVAENFSISRPAISKHVKILSECGLITIEQQGRERYCIARLGKLRDVSDWADQFRKVWTARLDALEVYLEKIQSQEQQYGRRTNKKHRHRRS